MRKGLIFLGVVVLIVGGAIAEYVGSSNVVEQDGVERIVTSNYTMLDDWTNEATIISLGLNGSRFVDGDGLAELALSTEVLLHLVPGDRLSCAKTYWSGWLTGTRLPLSDSYANCIVIEHTVG